MIINEECMKQAIRTGLGLNAKLIIIQSLQKKLFLCRSSTGLSNITI